MKSYWRELASPIIKKIIESNKGKTNKELKFLISKEYPFGGRENHPYKIWLDEIKRQLGEKTPLQKVEKVKYQIFLGNKLFNKTMAKVIKLSEYKKTCEHSNFILDQESSLVFCEDCKTYLNPVTLLSEVIDKHNELGREYDKLRSAYHEIRGMLMAGKK